MRNVFYFNGFNRFTWFNMGSITKEDRCLIKATSTSQYKKAVLSQKETA